MGKFFMAMAAVYAVAIVVQMMSYAQSTRKAKPEAEAGRKHVKLTPQNA